MIPPHVNTVISMFLFFCFFATQKSGFVSFLIFCFLFGCIHHHTRSVLSYIPYFIVPFTPCCFDRFNHTQLVLSLPAALSGLTFVQFASAFFSARVFIGPFVYTSTLFCSQLCSLPNLYATVRNLRHVLSHLFHFRRVFSRKRSSTCPNLSTFLFQKHTFVT